MQNKNRRKLTYKDRTAEAALEELGYWKSKIYKLISKNMRKAIIWFNR